MSADSDAEVIELRRRLVEAEETLRAIREGEVDALVVRGGRGERVFTLEGGDESYRSFMETMETGAAAIDADGRVLYANNALCQFVGKTLDRLQGHRLSASFGGGAGNALDQLIQNALAGGKSSIEIQSPGAAGDAVIMAAIAPLPLGVMLGYALTFTDITDRVRAAAIVESGRAARAIIASTNEAVVVCDRNGIVTHANAASAALYDGSMLGRRFAEVVPLNFPGATGLLQTEDLLNMAMAGSAVRGLEAVAPQALTSKDYLISAAPLQFAGNMPNGCVVTLVDLSARKAAEKQQLLLMAELDHRVKNTLALVLSISSRTASNEETLQGYQAAFTGRIQALAATHTLLAEKSWRDLSIVDVVQAELQPFVPAGSGRVNFEQLAIPVAPRAAIALGLIFHELATNAAKYGALSTGTGTITVRAKPAKGESLALEWIESAGPPVHEPTRRGFGRTVIARSLQYSPEGGAELEFRPDGVYCAIRVPVEDVLA